VHIWIEDVEGIWHVRQQTQPNAWVARCGQRVPRMSATMLWPVRSGREVGPPADTSCRICVERLELDAARKATDDG
jgi:hypothetical protein